MTDLSPAAEAVLNAVTLKQYDVPYQACPASIDQIKADAAAVLWAVANQVHMDHPLGDTDADFAVFAAHAAIRYQLLAIAAELQD